MTPPMTAARTSPPRRFALLPGFAVALFLAALGGCNNVERTLAVESDPPGALVYLNDQEVGRTPMEKEFLWYGTYDVQLRKEGYRTVKATPRVWAPIWQWPPFDLLAELSPFLLRDRKELSYELEPLEPADQAELIGRAREMRAALESSEYREPGEPEEIGPEEAGTAPDETPMRGSSTGTQDGEEEGDEPGGNQNDETRNPNE